MNPQVKLDNAMQCAQRGEFPSAITALSEMIEAMPNEGILFQALGSVLLQADKAQDAVPVLQHAASLLGHPVDVLELLGVALARTGQSPEALSMFDEVIRKQGMSTSAAVHRHRGNVLFELGRAADASRSFQCAVSVDPSDHRSFGNWGLSLKAQGHHKQAVEAFRAAVKLQPANAEYRLNLGNTLGDLGQVEEAELLLRSVCRDEPNLGLAHAALGRILCGTDRVREAMERLKLACELEPNEAKFHLNYGAVLAMMGHVTEPLEHFKTAIRLKPNYWAAWVDMGNLLGELGRVEESRRCFEVVLEREPKHPNASAGLASRHIRKGNYAEAYAILAPFVTEHAQPPVNVAVGYATCSLKLGRPEDALLVLSRFLGTPRPKPEQSLLLHAAGRAYDELGRYDDAFRAYEQSNRLRCLTYSPEAQERDVSATLRSFTREAMADLAVHGSSSEAPIFIVGMPRSGTSLVEQILCSHSEIHGAGELEFVRLAASMFAKNGGGSVFEGLKRVPQDSVAELAENHLRELRSNAGGKRFVTDKMPANFLFLGLIQQLYPNAKIVHCRRSKLDTCVSCFRQNFNASYGYTTRLDWLNHFHGQYELLMEHWREHLSLPMMEVDYEALVSDPGTVIPTLLEFCGVQPEEACLTPHKNQRVVHTASHAQVREPINTRSVGYAQRYKAFLGPLES